MGDVIQVEPRPEAYVVEWRAIQFDIADWQSIKRLLRPVGYVVYVDLEPNDGPVLVLVRGGVSVRLVEGDWIVISPHDKVLTMADDEFLHQFITVEDRERYQTFNQREIGVLIDEGLYLRGMNITGGDT